MVAGPAATERATVPRKNLSKKKTARRRTTRAGGAARPVLLSGGNPQIPMADGAAPVRAYIAALPGWKRATMRRLDALIVRSAPGVRKAVKWNSPFYGMPGQGWFLSVHAFTRYLKVAFFKGTALRPLPPGGSRSKDTRYLDVHEGDDIDETRFADWVRQASRLPGWEMTRGGPR